MKWVKCRNEKPRDNVEVYVKTLDGVIGTARYWSLTSKWLTNDKSISVSDVVIKWRYSDALL